MSLATLPAGATSQRVSSFFCPFFRDGLDTGLRTRKHLKKTNLNAPVYELHGLPCADVLYVILYWKDDLILRTQQRPDDF